MLRVLIRIAGFGAAVAALFWPKAGQAQVESLKDTDAGYEVVFQDGDLLGDHLSTLGASWTLRTPPQRVLLIRARTSFVPELAKSVEEM